MLLERTSYPGVYRRGRSYVVVYRRDRRQRKETARTFAQARAIKVARDAQAAEARRGPTLHAYVLDWVSRHDGSGHDAVREQTRAEYRRLLVTFALEYFPASLRLCEIDRRSLQSFISWLTDRPGRRGRLTDRSIRNAVTPLRMSLEAAAAQGLVDDGVARALVLPRRRGGRRWEQRERRFLTPAQLGELLAQIPEQHKPLFDLLASTGLRISEAIGLRWGDLELDTRPATLRVRRAIVDGVVGAPKSRYGARTIPLNEDVARQLHELRGSRGDPDAPVFASPRGGPRDPGALRRRVLKPAAERAGLTRIGFHTLRHTCASLLIEERVSLLRLQRWMGHHSAAYTLDHYGHLLDDDVAASPLDFGQLGISRSRPHLKVA